MSELAIGSQGPVCAQAGDALQAEEGPEGCLPIQLDQRVSCPQQLWSTRGFLPNQRTCIRQEMVC